MLHINDLTFRIEGRLLLESATAALPTGQKVGLVGRNGTGKSTLLKLILGLLSPETGTISIPRRARIGTVAQEAPGGKTSLLDTVLVADQERTTLLHEAETATDPDRIAYIHNRLADIEAHTAPSRAATILSGLGFSENAQLGPCGGLSGGWRMRVALAAALFAAPDVLLLDEPTNYLDLEGVIWLKQYLRNYRHTVLIVSHDRDLLNEAVNAILHLDQRKLTLYQGNYDDFERMRREKQALQLKLKKKQDDQRRHMEAFVDRFRASANKARQAQSRLKALSKLQPIADIVEDRSASFHFPKAEKILNPPLVRLEHASVGYEPGKPILRDINLRIDGDDRIALLGANGNGKSTFAKLLCGHLQVEDGHMRHHSKMEVAYFAQHQSDELDDELTPYDYFTKLLPDSTQSQRRAKLGQYGFGIEHSNTNCSKLSGGEKARLLFALASFHGPHILVLDEPTNHLDVDAREALIHAINEFEGAVILIAHDRHLVETCVDRLWLVRGGTVAPFDGDLDDYTRIILDDAKMARKKKPQSEQAAKAQSLQTDSKQDRKSRALARDGLLPLKSKIQKAESQIKKLQHKLSVVDRALAVPNLYKTDPKQANEFNKLRAKLAADVESKEVEWLGMQEELESLRA